jgi:hydroxypyruvate isomerase
LPRGWDGGSEKRKGGEWLVANEQNLIPLNERSKEDAKKIQQMGGLARGAARRRKRSMKDAAEYYLSLQVTDQKVINKMRKDGVEPDDIDNQMAIVVGLARAAMKGDSRSAKLLVEILGENPKEEPNTHQVEQHNALIDAIKNTR